MARPPDREPLARPALTLITGRLLAVDGGFRSVEKLAL